MDVPTYPEPLFITDAAINIFPDLEAKGDIVQNAIDLASASGSARRGSPSSPRSRPSIRRSRGTIDAAALCKMADRGQITGGLLDGPLALDNAISPEAAEIKGIGSPVAGRARSWSCPTSRPATCWRRT